MIHSEKCKQRQADICNSLSLFNSVPNHRLLLFAMEAGNRKRIAAVTKTAAILFLSYSFRSAVTGSLFAAFLDGISPPIKVRNTLSRISTMAGSAGSTALT